MKTKILKINKLKEQEKDEERKKSKDQEVYDSPNPLNIQAQPTLVNKSTYLKSNKEDVWFPKSIKERKKIKKLKK